MRIVFDSFDAFCQEIRERADAVRLKTVRAIILREPEQDERVSFQVGFMATAVIDDDTGEACLLEIAVQCGQDKVAPRSRGAEVGPADVGGSDGAVRLWDKLQETCEEDGRGLKLRNGKIELY